MAAKFVAACKAFDCATGVPRISHTVGAPLRGGGQLPMIDVMLLLNDAHRMGQRMVRGVVAFWFPSEEAEMRAGV
jgi:hypothetical protein